MAGSASAISSRKILKWGLESARRCEKITISWTGDNATGAVPDLNIPNLRGWLVKAVTNPGSTAPTDDYDITICSPDDTAMDAAGSSLLNRDTSNSEEVYAMKSGATVPIFFMCEEGENHVVKWANTSVNSATGQLILYIVDRL